MATLVAKHHTKASQFKSDTRGWIRTPPGGKVPGGPPGVLGGSTAPEPA